MEDEIIVAGKTKTVKPAAVGAADAVVEFRDDITAGNGQKHDVLKDKGAACCIISAALFAGLNRMGVPTHFQHLLADNAQLVRRAEPLPLEVIVRNAAAGAVCTRFNVRENTEFRPPLIEVCYKHDQLGDPPASWEHAAALGWATAAEIRTVQELLPQINAGLTGMLHTAGLRLVDCKLEFGRAAQTGRLMLIDEISPDTCRLRDGNGRIFDKDLYRRDGPKGVVAAYKEVLRQLGPAVPAVPAPQAGSIG